MKAKTLTITLALLVAAALGALVVLWQKPWQALGNIAPGNAMQSTTTPTVADRTNLCPPYAFASASSTTGTLASVNITGYGAGELMIIDATTSNATLRAVAATSSLILAHFPVTGTSSSPFNAEFTRGLFVDYTSGVGTSTITYRCGS